MKQWVTVSMATRRFQFPEPSGESNPSLWWCLWTITWEFLLQFHVPNIYSLLSKAMATLESNCFSLEQIAKQRECKETYGYSTEYVLWFLCIMNWALSLSLSLSLSPGDYDSSGVPGNPGLFQPTLSLPLDLFLSKTKNSPRKSLQNDPL